MSGKANPGHYFEDFSLGQHIRHATPRTVTEGDVALYNALYGSRFALTSSDEFARQLGFPRAPIDDLLVFHVVFGKSVADISINAIANLGYAEGKFGVPCYPGDTLSAASEVIGLRENSNRQSGIVYVRTEGINQHGETVLSFIRWVMVRKRDQDAPAPLASKPDPAAFVRPEDLHIPAGMNFAEFDATSAGSRFLWQDYQPGERIDHVDGMTVEEAEHMLATRLYQNSAKVHFNQHSEGKGRFGRRLIYGGHVISLMRALSFNGLGNGVKLVAINGGRHVAPCFAGDTVYGWSRIEAAWEIPGRSDLGALRIRSYACKDRPCDDFPGESGDAPELLLDFDYTVVMPRRGLRHD